ncbi:meiosis-specific coiled-coil domain-containing protein MEIOC isoform X1 [Anguilla anguilla]|uniref:meiosis-specific coiled-coil domain-containing protein MEIOC isoform X1 n=1 Tax=Anguilla anguilla TaxID=7936 RepID=UPI0015AF6EC1|nr:meiosis-specific coiled-coil domain-containing protein MEIOC isoform X1 [Anguilla anguilla]XP_035254916.1 meiosis-specific coiled-coil domain-containing protein MEIOC isoform X1 [Anguilla anguilla]
MAFSRFQSTASGSDSYFPSYKHQSSLCGDRVRVPQHFTSPLPFPGIAPQEESSLPYTPWAAREDPYQLGECAKNRTLNDGKDCGSESDLYGLVSDILEEPDHMDADFAEESLSSLKSVWSPNSAREDSQQYFLSESKMQSNSSFPSYPEPFNQCHRQLSNKESQQKIELHQSFNGFDVKNQWLFPSSNGDTDAYSFQTQDMERVLCQEGTLVGNSFLPKNNPEADYSAVGKMGGRSDHIEGVAPSFDLQNRLNDYFFGCNAGHLTHGRVKPHRSKQFPQPEGSMLARNMQGLLVGAPDSFAMESQNRQGGQRDFDEQVPEQQSFSYPKIPTLESQVQFKKDQAGDFRELKSLNSRTKTQSPTSNYYTKAFPGSQHAEHFQPPKGFPPSFTVPAPVPNKHMDNYSLPNQHPSHQSQLGQYLNQVKQSNGNSGAPGLSKMLSHSVAEFVPQHQAERVVSCLTDYAQGDGPNIPNRAAQSQAGLNLEGFRKGGDGGQFEPDKSTMHSNLSSVGQSPQRFEGKAKPQAPPQREGDRKAGFQPDTYLDFLGRVYSSQRHTGGNFGMNASGKKQPSALFPCMYAVGDPRQNPYQLQLGIGGFPSRSVFPYGSPVTFMDLCNLLPDGEFPPFNPYFHDISGDGPFLGMAAGLRSPRLVKNRCAPTSQLHYQLEECYEQWRVLEKERKKVEAILARYYPGKRVSAVSSSALPKVPPNPSRVDRLIVDQLREQARVVSLLGKMEQLRSFPLHANIFSALDRHLEAVYVTQTRRNEEFVNSSNRQRQGAPYFGEDRDILLLAVALRDMCVSTRKCRTALWCAVQMTLPQTAPAAPEELDAPRGF